MKRRSIKNMLGFSQLDLSCDNEINVKSNKRMYKQKVLLLQESGSCIVLLLVFTCLCCVKIK